MKQLLTGSMMLAFTTAHAVAEVDTTDGLTGKEVNQIVRQALETHGISSDPQTAVLRSFPACDHVPDVQPKYGSWKTVDLNCTGPVAWSRAVRTKVAAKYNPSDHGKSNQTKTTTALVLTKSLSRGTVLTAADLAFKDISALSSDQMFFDPSYIIGRKLTVNLGEGRAVLARHLEKAWLIEEKNPVAIVYSGGLFAVTAAGEALQDGQLGELIEVRNTGSGQVIKAIVAGRNKVLVAAKMN